MPRHSLTTLPIDIQARIAANLTYDDQYALLQTCKPLCNATREARRDQMLRDAQRPGRFSRDPFPTLLEFVNGGGPISCWPMNISAVLRESALIAPEAGLLQAAYRRRAQAADVTIHSGHSVRHGFNRYHGHLDAQGRPHGVGLEFAEFLPRHVYIGDWVDGKREGYGTQFYAGPVFAMGGGWYEGQWHNDLRHGLGMHVEGNLSFKEGCWNAGTFVGAADPTPK